MIEFIFEMFGLMGQRIFNLLPKRLHQIIPPESGLGQSLGILLGWLIVIGAVIFIGYLY